MLSMHNWFGRQGRQIQKRLIVVAITGLASVGTVMLATADAPRAGEARRKIEKQVAFGEFGAAIDAARNVADPDERANLLGMIANAQLKAGDASAARGTTRQMDQSQRLQAAGQQARQQALSGGVNADFQSLMTLIETETSGPWLNTGGEGGTMTEYLNGVAVSPNGLLSSLKKEEHTGRLKALGVVARKADLNAEVAQQSDLRFVSLTQLEREASKRLTEGRPIVETMKNLAGITQLKYVVVDPKSRDVLIGGPSEAWKYDSNGNPIGVKSGRPTLQLDDLVTVLRTFSNDGPQNFGCSFNPRQEGLQQLQAFVEKSNNRGPLDSGAVKGWVNQLQSKLGPQDIELWGVPRDSRVARVVTEADYRLKMIGIGKLEGGPHVPSIFELLTVEEQKSSKLDALRWWLTMKYDAILHSPDHNVFEIQGPSVQCLSENQYLTEKGERVGTGQADATNRTFAMNFTNHYAELAQRDIAFADLQNVFDLALVAALLKNEGIANRIGWEAGSFASHGMYEPAVYAAPREVESVANHRVYRGKDIVVQVAGGVRGDLMSVVRNREVMKSSTTLKDMTAHAAPSNQPQGRWWWDAK
ncbi:MAG: DUF1598 domain-containing protein [Planctomycetota bacterium]|nr:MAG: DUF1598 domain-containing protein [Planctomycetota bacterium]